MSNPIRILIVEDSALDAELVIGALTQGGYDVTHVRVETAKAMADALTSSTWDVVLSDHELPAFSGPAALALLQGTGLDLPFIMVSGTIGEELAVGSLKAGADDFLIKGRLSRLIPAIERERREAVARRDRQRAEEALRRSEADYRSLVDGAVFGIYRATIDGRFVTVNPAMVTMLGYASADELLGIGLGNLSVDPAVQADLVRRSQEQTHFAGESGPVCHFARHRWARGIRCAPRPQSDVQFGRECDGCRVDGAPRLPRHQPEHLFLRRRCRGPDDAGLASDQSR